MGVPVNLRRWRLQAPARPVSPAWAHFASGAPRGTGRLPPTARQSDPAWRARGAARRLALGVTGALVLGLGAPLPAAARAGAIWTAVAADGGSGAPRVVFGASLAPEPDAGGLADPPGPAAGAGLLTPTLVPATVGVTTDDYVKLRTGPGTTYPTIAELLQGTQRTVVGAQAGWYQVATAAGTVGWIAAAYFNLLPPGATPAAPAPGTVLANINDDGVNLRTAPGTNYSSYGLLGSDVQVTVLERDGDWYKARSPGGHVGWVATEYAALDAAVPSLLPPAPGPLAGPDAPSPNRDAALLAQQFEGAPYSWGGADLDGFDCSGFTWYIYRQLGVALPGKASRQDSAAYGRPIGPISALLPGDLVFFERTTSDPGITHVGIYVGEGRMIAARTERLGVRYVSLYEPFWNSRYVGGLRPYR